MKFFQHYLDNELALSKMRRALAEYHNIDVPEFRIAAYRQAGIPTETIIELDREALRLEKLRRATFAKRVKRVGKAAEAASFFLMVAGFYAVWCVTPGDAQAAVLTAWTPSWFDLALVVVWNFMSAGTAMLFLVWIAMKLIFPRRSEPAHASFCRNWAGVCNEPCEKCEALGDTSGWRGE